MNAVDGIVVGGLDCRISVCISVVCQQGKFLPEAHSLRNASSN